MSSIRTVRFAALASLLLGAVLLLAGVACSGGSAADDPTPAPSPSPAAPVETATSTPTPRPSPTPTPTPFAGSVARIIIPRFNVDAPIEELGITPDGALDTPKNENTHVGWYPMYDRPGWLGNAIFSAHVYYHSIPAPFVNLAKSQPGDEIIVVMADGTRYRYEVISNNRYHRDTIPMGDIIWPKDKADYDEWVTLITCGGELDATGLEYLSRDVVVAKRIFE
ncbi:class F sortase [Tepidiforma sp.]|uniref:class F sortase n=1 Tax=Tepidiforma sp. TaxID=2682230 RepID=UPI002ADD466E|nr:class F sortase [Tepidiforma sp.]